MKRIRINIEPMSKPRGQIGRSGKITHSLDNKGYRDWQQKFKYCLRSIYPHPFGEFFCLVYVFNISSSKLGRKQDLDNTVGAVNDALTPDKESKHRGWIKDDSWQFLPRYWVEARQVKGSSYLEIYICYSVIEFQRLISKIYQSKP